MSEERPNSRALEIAISEKVYARLKTQVLVVYAISFLLALAIGISLLWQHRVIAELSASRISEYRLLVIEKLDELHQLDLEEVARRTRPLRECESPLPRDDVTDLLTGERGRPPEPTEVTQILEEAARFGVCDAGEIRHIYEDAVSMTRVDTVYRLFLHRPADPIGRFIYGYWLASGIGIEAVARDIMASPEFQRLKKLSEP